LAKNHQKATLLYFFGENSFLFQFLCFFFKMVTTGLSTGYCFNNSCKKVSPVKLKICLGMLATA
jgi:hypothetical protein